MFDPNLLIPVFVIVLFLVFSVIMMLMSSGFIGPFLIGVIVGIAVCKLWNRNNKKRL